MLKRIIVDALILLCLVGCSRQPVGTEKATGQPSSPETTLQLSQSRTFPDTRDHPPDDYHGPIFQLSQDYPPTPPPDEDRPWERIDFKTRGNEYMTSVLKYGLEGNVEVDWVVQKNPRRRWFHAPWLHFGRNGREFVHGLTHERVSEPQELARTQTTRVQNWAVGIFNAPGGYTIGQVWRDPNNPDPGRARFAPGTVAVKLLFTQATVEQVPYLKGSKEWDAHIYQETVIPTNPLLPRRIQRLRLLQIDVAVRDPRADEYTGWVFGTFIYNGDLEGRTPWDRMIPVGLMWGNDPGLTVAMVRKCNCLTQSVINDSENVPYQHLGWGGRLNGAVDNPISSCLSCHSTAQWPPLATAVPGTNVKPDSAEWMRWFRNLPPTEAFSGEPAKSLSYSLQLAAGIRNFHEWQQLINTKGGASTTEALQTHPTKMAPVSREALPYLESEP